MSTILINEIVKKHYTQDILKAACERYNIKVENAKLIRGNANLIFDCGDKILRLSHSDIRPCDEIALELEWMGFLEGNKVPTPAIILSKHHAMYEQLGDDKNHFTVVCFEKIIGGRVTDKQWNKKHFKRLGQVTGLLHSLNHKYENLDIRQYDEDYLEWDKIPEFEVYKYLPKDDRNLEELHHTLVAEFRTIPKTKTNYGLIHYDIHHGNYFLTENDNTLVVFDFEMTCKSWYINDVATVLYYAGHYPKTRKDENFEEEFITAFWKGYEEHYQIEEAEKKWIPKFLLYRDLMVYGFLNKLWNGLDLDKGQKAYLERLSVSIAKRRVKLKL